MKKSDFNYHLPQALIAQQPLPERKASRLLCLDKGTGEVNDKQFVDFIDLIRKPDVLVFNDTKVIPARLYGNKTTGGKVEILLERVSDDHHALAQIKASKSPKADTIIILDKDYQCQVQGREGDLFRLEFTKTKTVFDIIQEIGHIPLPPYIQRLDDKQDVERYQSVFAKRPGAVAAPTASLHFDEDMLKKIEAKGVGASFVTLHVGSGTFQPLRVDDISQHTMHQEFYTVPPETVAACQQARANGGRIIAIGTTAVRALESASLAGYLQATSGETRLFITPGYAFKSVDAMLTNFHLPESTLIMLVAAFAGHEAVMTAYQHAVNQSYRFFSYGDAMFLA